MANQELLQIVIQARDEAKKTLQALRKELDSVGDSASATSKKVNSGSSLMGQNLSFIKQNLAAASLAATGFFAAMGLIGTKAVSVAAEVESSTLAFKTLLGDLDQAKAAVSNIMEDARLTPFDFQGLIQGNQMLISAGVSAESARKTILDLGNAIVATGGGNAEMSRVIANLQQIKNTGSATAADIKQFGYAGININALLAKATGKTTEEVANMKITYDMLANALSVARAEGGMFANALGDQGNSLKNVISNTGDSFNKMYSDVILNTGALDMLKGAFQGIQNAVAFITPYLTQFVKVILDNQGLLIMALGMIAGLFASIAITVVTTMGPALLVLGQFALAGAALAAVGYVLYEAWNSNFLGIRDVVMQFWEFISPMLTQLIGWLSVNIPTGLQAMSQAFQVAWQFIQTSVVPILQAIFTEIARFWTEIEPSIKTMLERSAEVFRWIFENVIQPYVMNFVTMFKENWEEIRSFLSGILNIIKGIVQVAWAAISTIIKVGLALLTGDWQRAWQAIKDGLQGVWNGIVNIVSGAWQAISAIIKSGINSVIGQINKMIDSFNSVSIGGKSANIPKIPKFEDGGWVNMTGPAIVHEGEFVLSRAMLQGRQQIPNNVVNNNQHNTYISAPINTPMDAMTLSHILGFQYANGGRY